MQLLRIEAIMNVLHCSAQPMGIYRKLRCSLGYGGETLLPGHASGHEETWCQPTWLTISGATAKDHYLPPIMLPQIFQIVLESCQLCCVVALLSNLFSLGVSSQYWPGGLVCEY